MNAKQVECDACQEVSEEQLLVQLDDVLNYREVPGTLIPVLRSPGDVRLPSGNGVEEDQPGPE